MTPASVIRRTTHKAPLCVCWNYFDQHLARAICNLANIHEGRASVRWDVLAPDEQDRIEAVIHTMAEAREKGRKVGPIHKREKEGNYIDDSL